MSTSNLYSVGLRNVGSYQVSGRPWLKHYSTTADDYEFIQFPNVTNSIQINNDSSGNKELVVMFCNPTRAVNMAGGLQNLSTSITPTDEFTVSTWIKFDSLASDQRIVSLSTGNDIRVQTRNIGSGSDLLRLFFDGPTYDAPFIFDTTNWVNIVLVAKTGDIRVYANGQLLIQEIGTINSNDTIEFADSGANFSGLYSTSMLFNKALSNAQVNELYTTEARLNPSTHSQAQFLESFWRFDDATFYTNLTPADNTTTIFDRVSGNDLTLSGGGTITFENGWTIDNAEARHSWTILGRQGVRGSVKTNRVLLKYVNNDEISVFAELTNIPASRMHELTGPGIDE